MSTWAAFASGTYLLGLSVVFIIGQWNSVNLVDLVLIIAASLAWGGCWFIQDTHMRNRIAPVVSFAFLFAVLIVPSSILWPPVATLAFSATIVGIGLWSTSFAIVGIFLSALATFLGSTATNPTTLLISTDFLNGYATTIVALTLPTAILIVTTVGRRAARDADSQADAVLEVHAQQFAAEARANAQAATARRIHETYLNTLVSLTDSAVDAQNARDMCSRLLAPIHPQRSPDLPSVGDSLAAVLSHHSLDFEIPDQAYSVRLASSETHQAFFDALHETLVNAARHADGCTAFHISVHDSHLVIDVSDEGPGNPEMWRKGFGITHNINGALDSIGARADYLNRPEGGTTVRLTVPLDTQSADVPPLPQWTVFLDTPIIRLALLPTLLVGALFVPIAASSLTYQHAIVALFFTFMASLLALAFTPPAHSHVRKALAVAALMLGISTLLVAGQGEPTCSSAVPMHWILYSIAGSSLLPIFTFANRKVQAAVFVVWIVVVLGVGSQWPHSCAIETVGAGVEAAVWNTLILVLYFVVQKQFVAQRAAVLEQWNLDLSLSNARELSRIELQNLTFANDLCSPLFTAVTHGDIVPGSPECQRQASIINSLTRTYLSLSNLVPHDSSIAQVQEIVEGLLRQSMGVELTIAHRNTDTEAVFPVILDLLLVLTDIKARGACEVFILDQSLLLTGPTKVIKTVCEGYVGDPRNYSVFPHSSHDICTAEISIARDAV